MRFICLYFIPLERIPIGRMPVKRKVVGLISIVLPQFRLFWLFACKVRIICRCSIKSGRIWSILTATVGWLLDSYLVRHVALFVLSLIIELGCVRLIGVSWLVTVWLGLFSLIVGSVCGFEEVRIVVCLVQGIGALDGSFWCNVVRLIELVVCGVSIEGDMLRWAMMFF